jgi:hypothetical protein
MYAITSAVSPVDIVNVAYADERLSHAAINLDVESGDRDARVGAMKIVLTDLHVIDDARLQVHRHPAAR